MGFIEQIAPIIQKYAPQYEIKVCSPIIAQAILESASGTSELAVNAHNYFGLKYRANRCPSACGVYYKIGSEQNKDGSYTSSAMQWMKFSNMDNGVKGYFDFINIANYKSVKSVVDPETYLKNIKSAGYATSLNYVQNLMNVIKKYNLTKYDPINQTSQERNMMGYTNSSLVSYIKLSPNKTSPRNHAIDTITIHCMAGNLSIETCGNVFAPTSRKASSNYGIGSDGRIAMYVEEKDRSWCSSNAANDHRAVTIEVANDGGAPDWHVSDKAMTALINLVADICKRNNIKELKWQGNKALIGQINKQNMTVHRWFAAKACPGNYLYNKHGYIADEVNKKLGVQSSITSTASTNTASTYIVVKGDNLSKIGQKTGIPWKTIADLNGIKFPYVVRIGQVLKLKASSNSSNSSSYVISNGKYIYSGVDYSPVFNPIYYANKYADLKKTFGNNANALFDHFIKYGAKEKRQACVTFDVNVYKNNYKDLRKAFGNNYPEYYKHYCKFGKKEGRKAV